MVSLGYVWTLIWSRIFFGELFNRHKVAGLALVLLGVFLLVSATNSGPLLQRKDSLVAKVGGSRKLSLERQ